MTTPVVLLMGPTASGKTDIAIKLRERMASDIISVDSALVYRGMDIGTAKPDAATLQRSPHQLVDIRDPEETYSAGDFVRDARAAIAASAAKGRVPLLVGGTMMYFRALTEGIADLPPADEAIRAQIDKEAAEKGWPYLHTELGKVDPQVAAKLGANDSQRIQRALEVYRISGRPLSELQREAAPDDSNFNFVKIALRIEPRSLLHQRIEQRLDQMIAGGFEEEMRGLRKRPGLTRDSSAMRSVGYRQFWRYLDGDYSQQEARDRTLYATRQLAKRQLTWLRSENALISVNALEANVIDTISAHLAGVLDFSNA